MSDYGVTSTVRWRATGRGDEVEWVVTIHWGRYWLGEHTARATFATEQEARRGVDLMIAQHVPGRCDSRQQVAQLG